MKRLKMRFWAKKMPENLRMSEKSSTFAPDFAMG
jgi:hypothetical protein